MKLLFNHLLVVLFSFTMSVCIISCSGSDSNQTNEAKDPLAGYTTKKIKYTGKSTEEFRSAAQKVIEEYRIDITNALSDENWALVQRELLDYWQLIDNMTPQQTGDIWTNEGYQNAYDNFATQIILDEAKVLLDKRDDNADEILLEMIISIKSKRWSNVDSGNYSHSDPESLMEKITPAIVELAELKGRSKVVEFFNED